MFCFYYTIWPWWLSKWPPAESMDLHQYNYFYNATIENTESRCCYNCSQCVYLSFYLLLQSFQFFFIRCHIYKLNMTDVKSNHHFSIRAHFSIMIILSISTVHIFAFFCHCLNKLACTMSLQDYFFANFYEFITHTLPFGNMIKNLKVIVHCVQNYQIITLLYQHILFFYFHY